jgi:hypothetical membrane protein
MDKESKMAKTNLAPLYTIVSIILTLIGLRFCFENDTSWFLLGIVFFALGAITKVILLSFMERRARFIRYYPFQKPPLNKTTAIANKTMQDGISTSRSSEDYIKL